MTIEEAKVIYKKNNCSLFIMAREDMDGYTLYKELNIDDKIEQKWRIEVIEELFNCLEESGSSKVFNQLYELTVSFHDKQRLNLMMKAIENVKIENIRTSLCMAETIMGRKILAVRSGMIFWAYDIGAKEETIILIEKVISLLNVQTEDPEEQVRISKNQKKIMEITNVLGLKMNINFQ